MKKEIDEVERKWMNEIKYLIQSCELNKKNYIIQHTHIQTKLYKTNTYMKQKLKFIFATG